MKDSLEEGINFQLCGFERAEILEFSESKQSFVSKFCLWKGASEQEFASLHAHQKKRNKVFMKTFIRFLLFCSTRIRRRP